MDSVFTPEYVEHLRIVSEHFTQSRYLAVAGYCAMMYDHILTLPSEIQLIWMKPKNLVSYVFLLNRYLSPIVLAIDMYDKMGFSATSALTFCRVWYWIEGYLQVMNHGAVHGIVALRVLALWKENKILARLIPIAYWVTIAATFAIATAATFPSVKSIHHDTVFNICMITITDWLYTVWLPNLLLETGLFVLTILKVIRHRRFYSQMPVFRTLYRDGFIYFCVIVLCNIFNIFAWTALDDSYVGLARYFTFAIITAMGSKIVLNLKGMAAEEENDLPQTARDLEMRTYSRRSKSFHRSRPIEVELSRTSTSDISFDKYSDTGSGKSRVSPELVIRVDVDVKQVWDEELMSPSPPLEGRDKPHAM